MRSHQSRTTNKLLSKLSVPDRRRGARSTVVRARPQVEPLEDRTLLDFAPLSFLETPFASHATPLAEHFHPHLHILIDGIEHVIPGDTNIVEQAGGRVAQGLYPIHTHQEDLDTNPPDPGKLHVESTQPFDFHLKDFFTLWTFTSGSAKTLTSREIKMVDSKGQNVDFKADVTHTITMTVDGQPNTDFENFVLTDPHADGDDLGPDIVVTGTTTTPPAPGSANQTFVTHCYNDFLGRPPDPGGLNHFNGLLDQGKADRAQVALTIETSLECRTKQVEDLYRQFLGRQADPVGLNLSLLWLGAGRSMVQLRETIVGSSEYYQRQNNDNARFVTSLYRDALARPVDPVGQGGAVPALNQGFNRRQLVDMVYTSPEGEQNIVQSYYHLLLHRQADAGGLDSNRKALQQGTSEDLVAMVIAGSQEYFDHR